MRNRQAALGACVAALLVFGAEAGPTRPGPAAATPQLSTVSLFHMRDRLIGGVLDVVGEIAAHAKHF